MKSIRASMLPSYPDCPRRSAAKQWPEIVASIGITLRELPPSIGATVGTASHVGAIGMVNGESELYERSIENLRTNSANGILYDTVTANLNDAEKQISVMLDAFGKQVLPSITDVIGTEIAREASAFGFSITGHSDLETITSIDDLKFGARCRPYHGQIGQYSLTRNANGVQPAKLSRLIWGPRTSVKKTFPGFTFIDYDIRQCEKIAWATIQHIKMHVEAFEKTGNQMSFPANPMSMMCTDKYCPAWGTRWCEYGGKV